MFRLITLSLFMLTLSVPAIAQDQNEQALKSMFSSFLNHQKEMIQTNYNAQLVQEGNISIEPQGNYYAVTLPFLKVMFPGQGRLDVGMISINTSPDTVDGRWKMAMAIPTPMIAYDKNGQRVTQINIGAQRAAGIWDESIKNFIKYDALYSDIKIDTTVQNTPFNFTIPQAIAQYDFREGDENALSGSGFITAQNMRYDVGNSKGSGSIGEIRADFEVDQFDIQSFRTHQNRLSALTQNLTTQGIDAQAAQQEILNTVLNMYQSFGEKFQIAYTVKDLSMLRNNKETGATDTIQFDNALIGMDVGGFLSNKVFLNFMLGYDGLTASNMGLPKDIMPSDVNVNLGFVNLPLKELSTIGQNAAKTIADNPDSKGMVGLSLMMRLPALLSQAGTQAKINNSYIGNQDYRFNVDGSVLADVAAVTGATAVANGTFKGLDTLINRTQYYEQTEASNKEQYEKLLQQLFFLKAVGQKSGGGDTYLYKFELTPSGQMLLNGQDAQSVLNGTP